MSGLGLGHNHTDALRAKVSAMSDDELAEAVALIRGNPKRDRSRLSGAEVLLLSALLNEQAARAPEARSAALPGRETGT